MVVDGLDLDIPPGRVTAIVGPNACGKSTLLRGLARLLSPASGTVLLDGADIHSLPTKTVATRLGLLPQSPTAPDGITVADLVGRGRYPHQGWFRRWTADDDEAVAEAMASTGVTDLADRAVDELSGGQRQRVWIAMALAQQTDILLLDEPTTFLDISHQIDVLDLLLDLNARAGHDRGHGAARPQPGRPLRRPPDRDEGGLDRRGGRAGRRSSRQTWCGRSSASSRSSRPTR